MLSICRLFKDTIKYTRKISTTISTIENDSIKVSKNFILSAGTIDIKLINLNNYNGTLKFVSQNKPLEITDHYYNDFNQIRKEILDFPMVEKIIENPNPINKIITEIMEKPLNNNLNVDCPPSDSHKTIGEEGYKAEVMIGIRRRKMKRHKLRKLRKKMKFEWAKVRQRREVRKEKVFQSEILAIMKEGETFSAQKYVDEKLNKANETPIPRYWKGKRLPQFIIKEKLGIK